ncbi:hypothetical protein Hanom_Chr07g00621871 [Helianthus anomalus]
MFSIVDLCRSERLKYVNTKFWHKVKFGDDTKVKVLQWGEKVPCPREMDDQDSSDEELLRRKREAGLISGESSSRQAAELGQASYSWGGYSMRICR